MIKIFRVFLRMKQINSSDLIIGMIKFDAKYHSQHDPHEANNFYCAFSPKEANGETY